MLPYRLHLYGKPHLIPSGIPYCSLFTLTEITQVSEVVPFYGSYLESYKVIPKRDY